MPSISQRVLFDRNRLCSQCGLISFQKFCCLNLILVCLIFSACNSSEKTVKDSQVSEADLVEETPKEEFDPDLESEFDFAEKFPNLAKRETQSTARIRYTATHKEGEAISYQSMGRLARVDSLSMDTDGKLWAIISWDKKREAGQKPIQARPPYMDFEPRASIIRRMEEDGSVIREWQVDDEKYHQIMVLDDREILLASNDKIQVCDYGLNEKASIASDELQGELGIKLLAGCAVSEEYIFLAIASKYGGPHDTEDIIRLDRKLQNQKMIIEGQLGCCSRLDMITHEEKLYVAENTEHRINVFDFDGNLISRFGEYHADNMEGFGACCNPVNIDIGPDGLLYTAESGYGRIKKYSLSGELVDLVGYVDTVEYDDASTLAAQACYIPVEVSLDGRKVFVVDIRWGKIRVLEQTK